MVIGVRTSEVFSARDFVFDVAYPICFYNQSIIQQ